jgi:quinol monooxygenase YgiN
MLYTIATMRLRPGEHADFMHAAAQLISATRQEAGCISYDLQRSVTDPQVFVFLERWSTRDAFEAHMGTPHMEAFRSASGNVIRETRREMIEPGCVEK